MWSALISMMLLSFALFSALGGAFIAHFGEKGKRKTAGVLIILSLVALFLFLDGIGIFYFEVFKFCESCVVNAFFGMIGAVIGTVAAFLLWLYGVIKA